MGFRFLLLAASIAAFLSAAAPTQVYTMKDLEALEENRNFAEFFAHAKDIRPSQRGDVWNKMVTSMADQYLKKLQEGLSISQKEFELAAEVSTWAPLKNDEFYAKKRNQLALAFFDKCLAKTNGSVSGLPCKKRMLEFFHTFNKEPELGIALAGILREADKTIDLWSFAAPMAQSAFGEFYCDKTPLYESLKKKLLSVTDPSKHAHKDCLKSFSLRAKKDLASSEVEKRTTSFAILEKLGKLEEEERRKHLIGRLLGASFLEDKAWGEGYEALQALGENPSLRKTVLEELSALNSLPDNLFARKERKRVMALTKQLAKNFPEYLDYYTGKCLEWLEGKGDFPSGNPTPNCHQYFEFAKILESSPQAVTKKYDKIMNSWKTE